jgi:hypothetical protein
MVNGDGRVAREDVVDAWRRRQYLVAALGSTATAAALSGCTGGGGATETTEPETTAGDDADDGEEGEDDEEEEELPEGVSEEEFERGPVPEAYRTATSLGGEARDPNALVTKSAANFLEYDDALEVDAHEPGHCCANCEEFIPDQNGDRFGACAAVEGYIDGADWCGLWEPLPEPAVPDGLSEDELPTAEVPDAYRTATSQAGEERTPDQLVAQQSVNFKESVEAIADGDAPPGQSCGNCAEYIPDQDGDGWGACAKVEGYVALEDWCGLWEHVSEG